MDDVRTILAHAFERLTTQQINLHAAMAEAQSACAQLKLQMQLQMQRSNTNHAYPVPRRKKGSCV